jgi:hypothetical protein
MNAALVSPTMIAAVKHDFAAGGVAQVLGGVPRTLVVASWLMVVVRWLLSSTPQDFGFFRSRWSCGLLALLLWRKRSARPCSLS